MYQIITLLIMSNIFIFINLFLMIKSDLQKGIVPDILQVNLLLLFIIRDFNLKQLILCIFLYCICNYLERKWHLYIGGADVKLIIIFIYSLGMLVVNLLFIASILGIIQVLVTKKQSLKFIAHLVVAYYLVVIFWL